MNRFASFKLSAFLLALALAISIPRVLAENHSAGQEAQGKAVHGEQPSSGTPAEHEVKSPFEGRLINSITTIVIFVVLLVVLGKFAWKPLLTALQKREEFIQHSLDQAKQDREEAEARLRELTERMNQAREEAGRIVEEGRRDAETVRRNLESQARAEADALIDRAKREIKIAGDTAIRDLYEAAADMATEIATRIIRKEITGDEHRRLIQDSIDEVRKLHEGDNGFRKTDAKRF